MASTWERIPQTHRTILFEEFTNPSDSSVVNLYDILSYYSNPDTSDVEMYKDITEKLEVRSFNEFLEKFPMKVFEYVTGTPDGKLFFQYTTDQIEAEKNNGHEVKITARTYYEMLVNMYSQKGESGVADIEFDDAKLREILTPKREMEALYDTRKQIPMLMEKYDEAKRKNQNAKPIVNRLKDIRRKALEQIKNPTTLMAIGLDDTDRKISAVDTKLKQLNSSSSAGGEAPKLLSGRGGFDDNGRWVLIPAKASTPDSDESTDSKTDPQGDATKRFANIIQNDLDKTKENEFTKALIVSAYTGVELADSMETKSAAELVVQRDELVGRKEALENSFKQAKEAFIQVLSESVQKLLSIKIFFDHATVKGGNNDKLPNGVGLIVTNCKASKLIDGKIKDKFESTMQHLGLDVSDKNKLWFAILPHVLDEDDYSDDAGGDDDIDGDLYSDLDDDAEEKISTNGTDFSAAKLIIKIMDKCKIMTVFNFAPKAKTTFSALNADTVNELQDKLEPINCEHAVYALPNFTIMREGTVPLDKENDSIKISVPAMYIDASYVAAGLLVAAQQPNYWLSRGFKEKESFISENACVRIDFESDKIIPKLLTKFNRERSINWEASVTGALSKKRFGFAFDGDRRFDEQTHSFIDKTYILNARTLKQKDGKYQSIFRTLTKDFIRAYLKNFGLIKLSTLKDFLKNDVAEWTRQRKKYNPEIINLLLKDGEDIVQEDTNLRVELSGGEDLLDVEVVD